MSLDTDVRLPFPSAIADVDVARRPCSRCQSAAIAYSMTGANRSSCDGSAFFSSAIASNDAQRVHRYQNIWFPMTQHASSFGGTMSLSCKLTNTQILKAAKRTSPDKWPWTDEDVVRLCKVLEAR